MQQLLKCYVALLFLVLPVWTRNQSIYHKLIQNLFENEENKYNPVVMPVCLPNRTLEVGQDMVLYQLFDLDEPTQQLMIDAWVETIWRDCRLTWKPEDFDGIKELTVRSSSIWFPQLIFYESLHGNFEEGLFIYGESTARIRHDGMIQLGCQVMLKSFCRVNIELFPFDNQSCNITFASWTADANMLLLRTKRGDSNSKDDHTFEKSGNGEWDVLDFPSSHRITNRTVGFDEIQVRPYAEVTFNLRLKRKHLYHRCYMIFPCMLLSWLGALVFIMPIESGEKIGYSTTLFLSLVVFLLMIADNIPRSSDAVPVLGVYFTLSVSYVALSVLQTILVLNVGLKQTQFCMPIWLKRVMESRISGLLCLDFASDETNQKWLTFRTFRNITVKSRKADSAALEETVEMSPVSNGNEDFRVEDVKRAGVAMPSFTPPSGNDWRLLAILMDRTFFWVYIALNIFSTLYIYCAAH